MPGSRESGAPPYRKSNALAVPDPIWIDAALFGDMSRPAAQAALLAHGMAPLPPGETTAKPQAAIVTVTRAMLAQRPPVPEATRPLPTLWVALDEAGERWALQHAHPRDDVATGPMSDSIMATRLQRLLARSRSTDGQLDALTGLLNRRGWGRVLRRAIDDWMPGDHQAVVYIDLDHFKQINDHFGHNIGDQVLVAAAQSLSGGLGPDDVAGRVGGDEFVVLLKRQDGPSLVRDAEQLLNRLGRTTLPELGDGRLSASGGLALLRPGTTEPQLLRQADTAAYEAKAQGRGRLVHFELIRTGQLEGVEADLQRFTEVTRMFGERMNRMVAHMGRQLLDAARLQALQDPLTGAHNRGFFKERLPREIERARVGGRPLAMALMDIDNFHDVNVTHGWPSGDVVLQRFVAVASKQIRVTDWLARYGGEEFVVVLPDTDAPAAATVLQRLCEAVQSAEIHALDGQPIPITVSIGLAAWSPDMQDGTALANAASQACLAAKRGGKNRLVIHVS